MYTTRGTYKHIHDKRNIHICTQEEYTNMYTTRGTYKYVHNKKNHITLPFDESTHTQKDK